MFTPNDVIALWLGGVANGFHTLRQTGRLIGRERCQATL